MGFGSSGRIHQPVEPALERRPLLALEPVDDLDGLLEATHAVAGRRQVDAVPPVLILVPAGPDAEDQSTPADVIDGHGLLQQHDRMPEGVARDERADADPRCLRRDGGQQRPCLVHRRPRPAIGVDEVVDEPAVIEPELLRELEPPDDVGEVPSTLAEEESEAKRGTHRASHARPAPRTAPANRAPRTRGRRTR